MSKHATISVDILHIFRGTSLQCQKLCFNSHNLIWKWSHCKCKGLKMWWTNSSGKQVNMETLHIAKLKSCKKAEDATRLVEYLLSMCQSLRFHRQHCRNHAQCSMFIISTVGWQDDQESKINLGHIGTLKPVWGTWNRKPQRQIEAGYAICKEVGSFLSYRWTDQLLYRKIPFFFPLKWIISKTPLRGMEKGQSIKCLLRKHEDQS